MSDLAEISTRAIEPEDLTRFGRLWERLSPETIYRRFHAPLRRLPIATVHRVVEVDHELRDAVVATVGHRDDQEIVGIAQYERSAADPTQAEMAVLIEDAWQGHGLGSRLVDEIIALAVSRGVRTLTAGVLAENRPMLHIMRRIAPDVPVRFSGPVFDFEIPLAAPAPDARAA